MRRFLLALAAVGLMSCSDAEPPQPAAKAPGFVDIVWRVSEGAAIPAGALYVFLSDGTLVITRKGDIPMTGSWVQSNGTQTKSEFTMVEQGLRYRTQILELTADRFRIRSHNPGEPLDINLERADR